MAIHLVKRQKKKWWYWYLVESKKVEKGKTRIVWQRYIGTAERLRKILEGKLPKPEAFEDIDFGATTALFSIAEEIGLREKVDRHSGEKRKQGLTKGQYLLIETINRCISPTSRSGIAEWYEKTVLRRLIPKAKKFLSTQNFWNNTHPLTDETLELVQNGICKVFVEVQKIKIENLIYDPTNFATFIGDHTNRGNEIPKRGKNKKKRFDLRQVNVWLLITKEFGIPLLHGAYDGNKHEAPIFKENMNRMVSELKLFSKKCESVTVVFDKGNNSEKNIQHLDDFKTDDEFNLHYVGSLKPSEYPDFLKVPMDLFESSTDPNIETKAFKFDTEIFGIIMTVVLTFDQSLYNKNLCSLTYNIWRCYQELKEFNGRLNTNKWKTEVEINKKVTEIISEKFLKNIVRFKVDKIGNEFTLDWWIDSSEFEYRLERCGKTILFTDNYDWDAFEIIETYRSKSVIEEDFKRMNNPHMIAVTPMYRWTDQQIKVHIFCCVVALLLVSLLRRKLHQHGIDMSPERLLSALKGIKEGLVFYPGMKGHRILSKMTETQKKLFGALRLERYL